MLNSIIEGISIAINTAFGDEYKIYRNDVKQGLQEPCFFIMVLEPELSPLRGQRFMKRNPFDIHYFPSDPGKNSEMLEVAETLMECLEFITLTNGDMLHGTSMSYEITDGVLHFMVNFNLPLVRPVDKTNLMETLETDIGTTGGE